MWSIQSSSAYVEDAVRNSCETLRNTNHSLYGNIQYQLQLCFTCGMKKKNLSGHSTLLNQKNVCSLHNHQKAQNEIYDQNVRRQDFMQFLILHILYHCFLLFALFRSFLLFFCFVLLSHAKLFFKKARHLKFNAFFVMLSLYISIKDFLVLIVSVRSQSKHME